MLTFSRTGTKTMSEQTDAECTREYQAVVKLEHVEVDSGEKDEELYYKQ